jgi:methylmalonyl-CoA/ethylmalonyl-CoA epimerase
MKFHHIGLAVSNIQEELKYYRSIGAGEFSPIYDDKIQNVKIVFFELGGIRYELVAPLTAGSPVDNFLKKKIRLYHTCFEVLSIEKETAMFQKTGALVILLPTKAIALANRRVTFLLTPNGDLIELLESESESKA